MSDERFQRLEEKIAHLEHHVTAQDKAMLELGDDLARMRRELKTLRERLAPAAESGGAPSGDEPDHERPPHY